MRRQSIRYPFHDAGGIGAVKASNMIRKPRDRESSLSTDIDALERLQIERYVERQSVITRAAANSQSDTGEFGAIDIHAGPGARTRGRHAQPGNVGKDG